MGFGPGASQLARLWEEQVRPATKKTASWSMNDPSIRSAAASAGSDVGGAEDGRVHLSAAAKAVLGRLACEGGVGGGVHGSRGGADGGEVQMQRWVIGKQARVAFLYNGGPLLGAQGLGGGQGSAETDVWEGLAGGSGGGLTLLLALPLQHAFKDELR